MGCDAMQVRTHPAVAHALKVRQALVFSQFTAFFKLYATAPNLGRALMDMCFSRVRFAALETVVDAFKNSKVKILYAATVLGFLVKPEGGPGSQPEVVSVDTAVNVDAHTPEGSLVLPGCAKTIHLGKHPAQVGLLCSNLLSVLAFTCIVLQFAPSAGVAWPRQQLVFNPCTLLLSACSDQLIGSASSRTTNCSCIQAHHCCALKRLLSCLYCSTAFLVFVTISSVLQVDAEDAAMNTIHWLQSCNAYVVLASG